jgi:hypothetical protein
VRGLCFADAEAGGGGRHAFGDGSKGADGRLTDADLDLERRWGFTDRRFGGIVAVVGYRQAKIRSIMRVFTNRYSFKSIKCLRNV